MSTTIAGSALLLAGAGLAAAYRNAMPEVRSQPLADRALAAAAFGLLVGAPALLALLSLASRPVLMRTGMVLLVPMTMLSVVSFVTPLLLLGLPTGVLLIAMAERWERWGRGVLRAVAAVVVPPVLVVAGVVALLVHQDPVNGRSGNDVVTPAESTTGLSLLALSLAVAWVAAGPRRRTA